MGKTTNDSLDDDKQRLDDMINCLISGDLIEGHESTYYQCIQQSYDDTGARLRRMSNIFSSKVSSNPLVNVLNFEDKGNLISLLDFVKSLYECQQLFKEQYDELERSGRIYDEESYKSLCSQFKKVIKMRLAFKEGDVILHKLDCYLKISLIASGDNITEDIDAIKITMGDSIKRSQEEKKDFESEASCLLTAYINLSNGLEIDEEQSNIAVDGKVVRPVTLELLGALDVSRARLGNYDLDSFELKSGTAYKKESEIKE